MDKGKSIFIFEYLSCGGLIHENADISLLTEGFSMLKALIKDFFRLGFEINLMIDYRINAQLENLKKECNTIDFRTISSKAEDFKREFDSLVINSEYIIVIAPEFQEILFNLVKRAERIINTYDEKHLLNPPSSFVFNFSDKLLTENVLKKYNMKFPSSFSLTEFLEFYESQNKDNIPKITNTFIMKPADGVGSINTFQISFNRGNFKNGRDLFIQLERIIKYIQINFPEQEYIIQNKIQGTPLSLSIINRNGEIDFFSINRQDIRYVSVHMDPQIDGISLEKIEYIGGTTPYVELPRETLLYLHSVSDKLCQTYPFTGFFGVDLIFIKQEELHYTYPNKVCFLEINPRITTPYIAYSAIFTKLSKTLAELFFQGSYSIVDQPLTYQCRYEKNKKTNAMDFVWL
ncbi:MAG: ATP-grasp domain-containing protein [Candidatus Lokiarchaeota archaeon]|nr:ATP-grasp domain-containing protein [Candidatus Lokiarchaeota archaeon]